MSGGISRVHIIQSFTAFVSKSFRSYFPLESPLMKGKFLMRSKLILIVSVLFILCIFQIADTLVPAWGAWSSVIETKHRQRITEFSYEAMKSAINERMDETSSIIVPEFMEEHFMYDLSAKRALIDLYKFVDEKKIQLPIFEDRVMKLDSEKSVSKDGPLICLGITTARRQNSPISYLIQGVSAILNRMNYKLHKDKVYIHVFNVDADPGNHEDIDLVRPLLPVTNVKAEIPVFSSTFKVHSLHHENMDYAMSLRILNKIGCQYPVMVEDDSVATVDWVEAILMAIDQLSRRPVKNDWLVVKFYTAREEYSDKYERGISEYDMGWNSVCNLINKEYILNVAEELESTTLNAVRNEDDSLFIIKDHTINKCAVRLHLKFLAFEPVIFQHTGIFSSVRARSLDKEAVTRWDMASKRFDGAGHPINFRREFWE